MRLVEQSLAAARRRRRCRARGRVSALTVSPAQISSAARAGPMSRGQPLRAAPAGDEADLRLRAGRSRSSDACRPGGSRSRAPVPVRRPCTRRRWRRRWDTAALSKAAIDVEAALDQSRESCPRSDCALPSSRRSAPAMNMPGLPLRKIRPCRSVRACELRHQGLELGEDRLAQRVGPAAGEIKSELADSGLEDLESEGGVRRGAHEWCFLSEQGAPARESMPGRDFTRFQKRREADPPPTKGIGGCYRSWPKPRLPRKSSPGPLFPRECSCSGGTGAHNNENDHLPYLTSEGAG